MGPLDSRPRRTALLALGLVVLAGLLAAPGTADQTERYNETITNNESLDALLVTNDTGKTTLTLYNSSGIATQQTMMFNDTQVNPLSVSSDTSRIVASSDRMGVDIRLGNLSQRIQSVDKAKSVEIQTNQNVTAAAIGYTEPEENRRPEKISTDIKQLSNDGRLSVNKSASNVVVYILTPIPGNATSTIIQEYYNKTISPDGSVEALRVSQTNDVPTERARVVISDSQNGTELVNETIDPRTTVSYGLVEFDSADNYTVTVTGVAGDTAPEYETTRRKTNQPILALGGGEDVPQSARILGIGLVVLALAAVLQHRKDP